MDTQYKQTFIRQKVLDNRRDPLAEKVLWSRHAIAALVDDGLNRAEVEDALSQAEIIEDYPATHRPLPDCLVLGRLSRGITVHAVLAVDVSNDRIFIVTVYIPSQERWQDDWRTRR